MQRVRSCRGRYWHPRCARGRLGLPAGFNSVRFVLNTVRGMSRLPVCAAARVAAGERRNTAVNRAAPVEILLGENMETLQELAGSWAGRAAQGRFDCPVRCAFSVAFLRIWRKRHERAKPDKIGHSVRGTLSQARGMRAIASRRRLRGCIFFLSRRKCAAILRLRIPREP